jgi:hypothetical protein
MEQRGEKPGERGSPVAVDDTRAMTKVDNKRNLKMIQVDITIVACDFGDQ